MVGLLAMIMIGVVSSLLATLACAIGSAYHTAIVVRIVELAALSVPADEREEQVDEWLAVLSVVDRRKNKTVVLIRALALIPAGVRMGGQVWGTTAWRVLVSAPRYRSEVMRMIASTLVFVGAGVVAVAVAVAVAGAVAVSAVAVSAVSVSAVVVVAGYIEVSRWRSTRSAENGDVPE